jgi:hypothetical protein
MMPKAMDWQELGTAPKAPRGMRQGPIVELRLPGGTSVMARYVAPRHATRTDDCPVWGGWQRVEDSSQGGEPMNDRLGLQPDAWRPLPA